MLVGSGALRHEAESTKLTMPAVELLQLAMPSGNLGEALNTHVVSKQPALQQRIDGTGVSMIVVRIR